MSQAKFSRYAIIREIGRGGMATLYLARDPNFNRDVAIKVLSRQLTVDPQFIGRFRREAQAIASLEHPAIVPVYDYGEEENQPFLVMRYMVGGTLQERIEQRGRLSLDETIRIYRQIAPALDRAHSRGIIHRDLKPANILFDEDGNAYVSDFGIAKLNEATINYTGNAIIGTPAYMSPEQIKGEQLIDGRSDVYSLGVMLYEMLSGEVPYKGETPTKQLMKHVLEPIPRISTVLPIVPPAVEAVLMQALAKEPDDRFATTGHFAQMLARAAPTPAAGGMTFGGLETIINDLEDQQLYEEKTPAAAPPPPPPPQAAAAPPPAPRPGRKRKFPLTPLLLAGAVLAILFLLGYSYLQGSGEGNPLAQLLGGGSGASGGEQPLAAEGTPTAAAGLLQPAADDGEGSDGPPPTETAAPTATPSATPSPSPSPTATADPTEVFLSTCSPAVGIDDIFTYGNRESQAAPAGGRLTLTWVLSRPDGCPWPADLRLVHVRGADFETGDGAAVRDPGEGGAIDVALENLRAPSAPGSYDSTWQVVDAGGNPVGDPIIFTIEVFQPATATPLPPTRTPVPAAPTATATAAVPPTATPGEALGFNVFFSSCSYPDEDNYRCELLITPFGGPPATYTILVFDADQPARYEGSGNQTHILNARRCGAWVHEIRVQNDASGETLSRNIFFDPKQQSLFPGGTTCTEPN